MNTITVVGTFHTESGACTSDELLNIIQKISPSVIFCEASPQEFLAMLKATESFNPPEIKALRVIIEKQSMNVVPIDLFNEDPFDRRLESMFELFRNNYREYFCASEIHAHEIYEKGFPYLNSNDSDQIFSDKYSMEVAFVSSAKHFQLSKTHKDWLEWNDKREDHWINVIHDYVERNKISSAILLVGSAHRIRLMEKIKNLQSNIASWDFYPFK
jgi:hypothetical protein